MIDSNMLDHQRFSLVNRMFNTFVHLLRPKLPEFHFNPEAEATLKLSTLPWAFPHVVSMRKLYNTCGKSSGLVTAIQSILKGIKNKHNLYIVFIAIKAHGWYKILRIFYKKRKQ